MSPAAFFAAQNPPFARSANGGEGGIRTPGTLADTRDFQSRTFDHSVTSPSGAHVRRWEHRPWAERGHIRAMPSRGSTANPFARRVWDASQLLNMGETPMPR